MNILFVINSIEPGGAEVFLLRFTKALKARGHGVFILPVKPRQSHGEFQKLFIQAQIEILEPYQEPTAKKEKLFWKINALYHLFGIKGKYVQLKEWDKIKYYQKLIKNLYIDVINSHLMEADYFAVSYLKRWTGLPVVCSSHGCYNSYAYETSEDKNSFLQRAEFIFRNSDVFTYLTNDNKYLLSKIIPPVSTPFQKIYLGYERPITENKNTAHTFKFGMIARGIKEKGWEEAIEAFIIVQKKHHDCELILICPKTDYILSLERNYKENSFIKFTGYLKNPETELQHFDLSLLPTYFGSESLPITVIESLSFGIPVLASEVGEIKSMLLSESNELAGKTFKLNEKNKVNVNSFADSMVEYIENKELLIQHQQLAFSAAQKFSMERCIENYLKLYRKVIEE